MSSIFVRGRKLYAKIQRDDGKWIQVATGFGVGQENEARAWVADRDREAARARARVAKNPGAMTVERYALAWLDKRHTKTVNDDRARLVRHALPVLGALLVDEVRPRHLRDLIESLKQGPLAPKTIREISGLLHTMFKSAVIDELITENPVQYERGTLPKKADQDPTWRHQAIYERKEVEKLISDSRIPFDRRVLYALKSLAFLRHGEASRLTWAEYDTRSRPLGALNLGLTKTGVPRRVPVHPVLAAILKAWRGDRKPTDLLIPTRRDTKRDANESQRQLVADLELIGLRVKAGEKRRRRGHDLRRAAITLARTDGAIDSWLRWVTHGGKASEILDVYSSPPWEALCNEIAKLRIKVPKRLGAAMVQPVQTVELSAKKRRPRRDSKLCAATDDSIVRMSKPALAGRLGPRRAAIVGALHHGLVQSRCDVGLAMLIAASRR